jgi:hypothetical protein
VSSMRYLYYKQLGVSQASPRGLHHGRVAALLLLLLLRPSVKPARPGQLAPSPSPYFCGLDIIESKLCSSLALLGRGRGGVGSLIHKKILSPNLPPSTPPLVALPLGAFAGRAALSASSVFLNKACRV